MRSDNNESMQEIPAPLRELMGLFESRLVDVRFPGIDGETLAEACDRLAEHCRAVDDARQALDEAQRAFDAELDEVRALGRRALSYLEVYAQGDEALLDDLQPIRAGLGGAASSSKSRPTAKRRRRKKAGDPELPLGGATEEISAGAA